MRAVGQTILSVIALLLLFSPHIGLLFGLSLIGAGIGSLIYPHVFIQYAWVGLKVYVAFAVFTFAILSTFRYQNCCVGMNTFKGHVRHSIGKIVTEDAFGAAI